MDVNEIIQILGGSGVIIVALGLIKVEPLHISIWNWLFRNIGKAFNGEVLSKQEEIQKEVQELNRKLEQHEAKDEVKDIINSRRNIARFSDEMFSGAKHSKDHFETIIGDDINPYEKYCREHPEFKNDQITIAINRILEQYKECLKEHSFL